jgi:ketosteroid isomerase-like protein
MRETARGEFMLRSVILVFTLFLLSFAAYGQRAGGGTPDPAKQVRDAFDRLIDGIRQVDAAKVMDAYEKSDRLLIFNNNGTATIGWENVRNNVESSYAKISNVTLEVTGVRVEMLGKNFAYVSCKWTQQQENDGKPESAAGRMTLIYKLVGKDWKVTHRHTSPDRPDVSRPVFPSERENQ